MPAPPLTTAEYLRTPETLLPQELVYGLVRDAAAPTPKHQWAVGDVYRCLWKHLSETGIGRIWTSPIDVILDRERALVVQPDVIVVLNDRLQIVSDRVWGAPDLVVEVLSPRRGSAAAKSGSRGSPSTVCGSAGSFTSSFVMWK